MKLRKIKLLSSSVLALVLCLAVMFTTIIPPISASATSGNWTGGQVARGYRLKVVYSESQQNPKNNTSLVTATLYLVQDRTYSLYIGTRSATITINGAKTTISNIPAIQNNGNVTTRLGAASATVAHNADGSKSVAIAATFDMKATLSGTYYGTMSTSQTVALDKLDRAAPTVSLRFNSSTANSVNLTATANTPCDTWQYSTNGGSSWVTFASSGTSNTFNIGNLAGGTAYSVVVRARKISNYITSAKSGAVTATTKPTPPGGLTVGGITQTSADLAWNGVTGANSYKLYLNDALKASGITAGSYTFSGLTPNTSYKFGVCATGVSGDSSIASTANYITLPSVPTELNITNQTDSSVSLSWSQDNGGNAAATTFNIYRDGALIGPSSTAEYTDTSYSNTDSSYTVSAVTSAGESARSAAASVEHISLSMAFTSVSNPTFVTVTPSFTGGTNREIDYNSLKWAYGSQSADYFADNGYKFTNSFTVLYNGTYTVFAKDISGYEAVGTVEVRGIYTKPTQGAFIQTFTDLSVDSIGMSVAFERTYNSMDDTDNIFGSGWSLNYAKSTRLSDGGTVRLVYLPDGTINYFSVSDNTYTGIGTQNKLTANGSKLILTTKDRIKYTYENNYLTRIEDASGNTISIRLNSAHLPVRITDSVGRVYTISYYNNKITGITDPAGRIFSYTYDSNGNLADQRQADGGIVNKFIYTDGLLTKITDSLDNTVCEMLYNPQRQAVSVADSDGNTTYYLHKITNNGELVIYESDSEIVLDETDCTTHPTSNTYNPFGLILLDSDGLVYEYNSDGSVHKIDGVNSDKTLIVYTYDANGNVIHIETTDKNERLIEDVTCTYTYFTDTDNIATAAETTVTNTYDGEGTLTKSETKTVEYSYDAKGNLLSERTVRGGDDKTTAYTYNNKGLMLSETKDGTLIEYTYDVYGYATNIKTIEEGIERNASFSYNKIGQVLSHTENGLTVSNIYDLTGKVIRETKTDGTVTRVTRTVYDNNGRAIQIIKSPQYDESRDEITPDENGICDANSCVQYWGERFTYDAKGNVLIYINEADNKTVNTYDSENRLVKTVTYEIPEMSQNGLTTRYIYDEKGNLIQTVYPHQYKPENDILDLDEGINEYMDNPVELTAYDENGNITRYIDSFGKTTVNTHDSQNHLVKSVSGNEITRYVYNGGDNLLQVIYPDQYNADDDNLNLSAESPVDTYANSAVGDRYTYDADGRVLTYTNRYGCVTTNTYDSEGNLTSTARSDGTLYTFDKDGKIEKETFANGLVRNFAYTSNQTVVTGSNGVTATYNMNAFGEVSEYKLQNGESNKSYSYTYDSDGNITSISLNGSLRQRFSYNWSKELSRVDDAVANKSVTYGYDYVGNIIEIRTYAYSSGDLSDLIDLKRYTYDSQNRRTDLGYDANGNINEFNGNALIWSGRRLTEVADVNNSILYTYNHNGIRTSKNVNGVVVNYTVDENNNITEQTDGTNTMKFVYDSSGSPVYFIYNDTTYYYEKNLQGDIVAILDGSGNTVVEYSYDIWGKLLNISGTLTTSVGAANPLRYRGYYYDSETGFYYLQSRYYSPDLMRFISQDDPVLSNLQGEPLGSNLYVYCNNEPVRHKDPTGHIVLVDDLAILGIAVTAIMALNLLTSYMSTPQFQQSWCNFTSAISIGLNRIWSRITVLFQKATTVVNKAVETNIAKAKAIIQGKRHQDYYWIASKVTFKRKNVSRTTYFPCIPISKAAAIAYVRCGGDVFASSSASARRLAIAINGYPPVGPEKHGSGLGYFYHYHARNRIGAGRGGGHIFYLW